MKIPAFPVNKYEGSWVDGTDLRDYFAAKVLTSLVRRISSYQGKFTVEDHTWCSEESYRFADAMIKAREETK